MPEPAPKPRLRRSFASRWRPWSYPLLLLAGSCTLAASEREPQDDLDGLVTVVARGGDRTMFLHEQAAVGVLPGHGWTLTLYVGDTRRFAPAVFLVLTRMDGRLGGQLILEEPSGVRDVQVLDEVTLTPERLDAYLARAALDLRGLDAVFATRFGGGPLVEPGVPR